MTKDSEVIMTKEEKLLELYKIAIDGYQKHWDHYNHWMNMYAIFNGALFVGFYTLVNNFNKCKFNMTQPFHFLIMIILILGSIASWCWHCSIRGFYRWLLSWINIIIKQENALIKCFNKNEEFDEVQELSIYGTFVESRKTKKCVRYKPFSTQKLTKLFTFITAIFWSGLTILFLFSDFKNTNILKIIEIILFGFLILWLFICIFIHSRELDLYKTHNIIIKEDLKL